MSVVLYIVPTRALTIRTPNRTKVAPASGTPGLRTRQQAVQAPREQVLG